MYKLENRSYEIRANSKLSAIVPKGNDLVPVSVSAAFKAGTDVEDLVPAIGDVKFDTTHSKYIELIYEPRSKFAGLDEFEFIITYENDLKHIQKVSVNVKQSNSSHVVEEYREVYLNENNTIAELDLNYDFDLFNIPTSIDLSNSDKTFSVNKNVLTHTTDSLSHEVVYPTSNTKILSRGVEEIFTAGNGVVLKTLPAIKFKIFKRAPFDGDNYISVKFKGLVNKEDLKDSTIVQRFNILFHARSIDELPKSDTGMVVPAPPQYADIDMRYPDVEDPQAPSIESDDEIFEMFEGDLLRNTKAHKEINNKGNKTIRLGNKVPEGAVNLAYYYNKTSSLKDTVSVIETDTNTVTLEYVEQWRHKNKLDSMDEEHFPDSIEFNGEEGTDLEGYWGVLYRDFVMWDEIIEIDQNPESAVIYEEFIGLSENRVPMSKFYNNGQKSGNLSLAHSIYTATNFKYRPNESPSGFMPRRWSCQAKYEGLVRDNKTKYNGSARYSGVVAKKDGMSNLDPEQPREILMFPNTSGLLFNSKNETLIDDDLFYITDMFKDGEPLYYKHKLKYKIYDNIGPDKYGVYNSDSIKLISENHTPIVSEKYKYKVKVVPTQFKNIYEAYLYTSFVPSLEVGIFVMYDGISDEVFENGGAINPTDVKTGVVEKLSVIQAKDTDEYIVETQQGLTQQSTITMNEVMIIDDNRDKIKIKYYVTGDDFKTPPLTTYVVNKDYALYTELDGYIGEDMIASPKNNNGYMTAKDILLQHITDEEANKLTADSVYNVKFFTEDTQDTLYNKDKTILYTDPDGKGLVLIRTYCDTGLPSDSGEPVMNMKLDDYSMYKSINGKIHKGFMVKCRNVNQIVISQPKESNPLKGWYPKIRYSYFNKAYERMDNTIQLIYSVPEYRSQIFGKYGSPYVDIKNERPQIISNNAVRVKNTPMYIKTNSLWIPENIRATRTAADGTKQPLAIINFNFESGVVEFENKISDNDVIEIDYSYEERYFHYRGYYEDMNMKNKLINLNLNPSSYFKYTDNKNEVKEEKKTYELFNRTIHFFLRPTRIIDKNTGEVETDNLFTIYHKFDDQESEGAFDLHIGRIFVRHHASLKSTELLDTRKRGGGLIEAMSDSLRRELEPESDYYLDIGTMDGSPYQENSVIIVRIDNRVLEVNGGRFSEGDVKEAVERWCSFGTFPIIEFVSVLHDEDMPQSTMIINKHIINSFDFRSLFDCEIVNE